MFIINSTVGGQSDIHFARNEVEAGEIFEEVFLDACDPSPGGERDRLVEIIKDGIYSDKSGRYYHLSHGKAEFLDSVALDFFDRKDGGVDLHSGLDTLLSGLDDDEEWDVIAEILKEVALSITERDKKLEKESEKKISGVGVGMFRELNVEVRKQLDKLTIDCEQPIQKPKKPENKSPSMGM